MAASGSVHPADDVSIVKGRFDGGILERSPLPGEPGGLIEATPERRGLAEGTGESTTGNRLLFSRPPSADLQRGGPGGLRAAVGVGRLE